MGLHSARIQHVKNQQPVESTTQNHGYGTTAYLVDRKTARPKKRRRKKFPKGSAPRRGPTSLALLWTRTHDPGVPGFSCYLCSYHYGTSVIAGAVTA